MAGVSTSASERWLVVGRWRPRSETTGCRVAGSFYFSNLPSVGWTLGKPLKFCTRCFCVTPSLHSAPRVGPSGRVRLPGLCAGRRGSEATSVEL
jgi:hypothetical protein